APAPGERQCPVDFAIGAFAEAQSRIEARLKPFNHHAHVAELGRQRAPQRWIALALEDPPPPDSVSDGPMQPGASDMTRVRALRGASDEVVPDLGGPGVWSVAHDVLAENARSASRHCGARVRVDSEAAR